MPRASDPDGYYATGWAEKQPGLLSGNRIMNPYR